MFARSGAALAAALLLIGLPAFADEAAGGAVSYKHRLTIEFVDPPEINVVSDEFSEEEEFTGRYSGTVTEATQSLLTGADVVCEFDGIAAPGRSFSCGFTTVEQVAGRCLFATPNGDVAVAEWSCQTGAMMTSDARCEGKAVWIEGSGLLAGITGEARFHSDLFLQPGAGFAKWKGNWRLDAVAELTD